MKEKTKVYYGKTWEIRAELSKIIRDLKSIKNTEDIVADLREDIDYLKKVESDLFDSKAIVNRGHIICIDKIESKLKKFDMKYEVMRELYLKISYTIWMQLHLITELIYNDKENTITIKSYTYLKRSTTAWYLKPHKHIGTHTIKNIDLVYDHKKVANDIIKELNELKELKG